MKKILLILFTLLIGILNCHAYENTCTYEYTEATGNSCKIIIDREDGTASVEKVGEAECSSDINTHWLFGYTNIHGDDTEYYYKIDACDTICYRAFDRSFELHNRGAKCENDLVTLMPIKDNNTKLEASTKYQNITACRDTTYEYIKECACMSAALTDLTSRIYSLIKIAAPALLLIVGGFDLIKAMSAQDEKAIGKARQKLVKKFIAAAAVFLIFTIVQFLVSTLAGGSENTLKCVDYILNGYKA